MSYLSVYMAVDDRHFFIGEKKTEYDKYMVLETDFWNLMNRGISKQKLET